MPSGTQDSLAVAELTKSVASEVALHEGAGSVSRPFGQAVTALKEHWQMGLLVLAAISLYAPVLRSLMGDWFENPDYSHGFFVPLLSGFLVWRKREELKRIAPVPSVSGLFVVLAALGLLFLGSLGAELFLTRVAIVITIAGLIIYLWGWKMLRAVAFPVAFLLLMIPLPVLIYNEIVFPLQLLASRLATSLLDVLNLFPVVNEGNILVLPYHRLEVVEACSGIRSLMSLIALSLGYGYLAERNRYLRAVLVLLMIPLAVASNSVRVVGTALLTYYWGSKLAEGFMHSFSGWVIFIVATMLLLFLHGAMSLVRRRWSTSRA